MKKNPPLTQESFDKLLTWLHPDRERAGQRYEDIRRELIRQFMCRGYNQPEEFADETINRVAEYIDRIAEEYEGDPTYYFYAVAREVFAVRYLHEKKLPSYPRPPLLL